MFRPLHVKQNTVLSLPYYTKLYSVFYLYHKIIFCLWARLFGVKSWAFGGGGWGIVLIINKLQTNGC